MLTRIASRTMVFILSIIFTTTSVFAAANVVPTSIGHFQATNQGLVLTSDYVKFGILFSMEDDGTWYINPDRETIDPIGFVVTEGRDIAAASITHLYHQEMWAVWSLRDDQEFEFQKNTQIVIPVGTITVSDQNQMIITTDNQDPSNIIITYNKKTKVWNIQEIFPNN